MEQHYAQAVYELARRGASASTIAAGLRRVLDKRGHTAIAPRVARALQALQARDAQQAHSELVVARAADEEQARAEVSAHGGIDTSTCTTRVDERVVGGWRVRTPVARIDTTYKRQLERLYQKVSAQT